ncbi:transcriptional regulator FeaR [Shimwellia blattae]|uniref:Regulatory protein for 2-phenylethylamine catabolism n=1 Tax=Shimwellia blattae (strain ATCC 29907 / DSM 4481 / JCM 1650 / NBRC 105725 / CDC 9005-74) TaxID=630626 RepID=I2B955_SHIBC|nr:transcriptional regulator FeaR [Shimwellia blattae]AFJ47059.1 regulatory protein for 2-phenylethylamine catabolism [Shimwellia blattae DSM 4481 = NBRC 105725]GAB80819.1 AraC family transcriptional activator FeaR [Shimwellia blattae DSM 4481 = NBRC 105725]VDY64552.1 Transcriptional activator feaR [Shimwellia blattae]VEC22660.1 Transcriptional activator feaR [Shimwellia blattae]
MGSGQHEHFDHWLAAINQACGQFAARPLVGEFSGKLDEFHAHQLKLSTVTVSAANLFRTRKEIALSNDAWFFTVFQLSGEAVMEQEGHQTVLRPGDITLIDAALPSSFVWQQQACQVSLLLPRQTLEQTLHTGRVPCATRLDGKWPVVRLCHQLLRESMQHESLSPRESEAALEAIMALLRPVLVQQAPESSRRERQFQKVLALIDEHIQSDALRPEWLASTTGMSVRSLYRMFAEQGLVVAQYIKNRRLDLCAQALRTASQEEKLAGIGYHWGFTDHSHFSTAFRQRFGISPGEYRRRWQ